MQKEANQLLQKLYVPQKKKKKASYLLYFYTQVFNLLAKLA